MEEQPTTHVNPVSPYLDYIWINSTLEHICFYIFSKLITYTAGGTAYKCYHDRRIMPKYNKII